MLLLNPNWKKAVAPLRRFLFKTEHCALVIFFVAGGEYGKVRALINDQGKNVKEAGLGVPC